MHWLFIVFTFILKISLVNGHSECISSYNRKKKKSIKYAVSGFLSPNFGYLNLRSLLPQLPFTQKKDTSNFSGDSSHLKIDQTPDHIRGT